MNKEYIAKYKNEFLYLFELQQSGRTNMFGAVPYLVSEMELDKVTAKEVLSFWMANYDTIANELQIEV